MEVKILHKPRNKLERDIRRHYPVCPTCSNKEYRKLVVCHICNNLVCENCKNWEHK